MACSRPYWATLYGFANLLFCTGHAACSHGLRNNLLSRVQIRDFLSLGSIFCLDWKSSSRTERRDKSASHVTRPPSCRQIPQPVPVRTTCVQRLPESVAPPGPAFQLCRSATDVQALLVGNHISRLLGPLVGSPRRDTLRLSQRHLRDTHWTQSALPSRHAATLSWLQSVSHLGQPARDGSYKTGLKRLRDTGGEQKILHND